MIEEMREGLAQAAEETGFGDAGRTRLKKRTAKKPSKNSKLTKKPPKSKPETSKNKKRKRSMSAPKNESSSKRRGIYCSNFPFSQIRKNIFFGVLPERF